MLIHSLGSSRKLALSFVLVIATLTVVDTTIVGFIAFSNIELPTLDYLVIFVGMFMIFIVSASILLKVTNTSTIKRPRINLRWLSIAMYIVELIIIGIILSIVLQMTLLNNYHINLLEITGYITHLSTLFFLGYLVTKLVKWIRSNKNLMLMAYAVSFSLLCVYLSVYACILHFN